jgi:hypothetical protein
MSNNRPAAATPARAWMRPGILLSVVGILAIAVVALAVVAIFFRDDSTIINLESKIVSCDAADPKCTLRKPVHEHANFAVFIRGQKFDFNKPEFIGEEGAEFSEVAHIHRPRYNVAHVHMSGTTWAEFLKSLRFDLVDPTLVGVDDKTTCLTLPDGQKLCNSATEKLHFIVNGVKVDGAAQSLITDLDRVLISYGSEDDEALKKQFEQTGDDACIPSERCKDRIDPNDPKEPCTGQGTCTG